MLGTVTVSLQHVSHSSNCIIPSCFRAKENMTSNFLHNRCVKSVKFSLYTTSFVKKKRALTRCPLSSFWTYAPDNAKCYNGLALVHSIEGTFFFKECDCCWSKGWSDMQMRRNRSDTIGRIVSIKSYRNNVSTPCLRWLQCEWYLSMSLKQCKINCLAHIVLFDQGNKNNPEMSGTHCI